MCVEGRLTRFAEPVNSHLEQHRSAEAMAAPLVARDMSAVSSARPEAVAALANRLDRAEARRAMMTVAGPLACIVILFLGAAVLVAGSPLWLSGLVVGLLCTIFLARLRRIEVASSEPNVLLIRNLLSRHRIVGDDLNVRIRVRWLLGSSDVLHVRSSGGRWVAVDRLTPGTQRGHDFIRSFVGSSKAES